MCNAGYELQYENTFPVMFPKGATENSDDSNTDHAIEMVKWQPR